MTTLDLLFGFFVDRAPRVPDKLEPRQRTSDITPSRHEVASKSAIEQQHLREILESATRKRAAK